MSSGETTAGPGQHRHVGPESHPTAAPPPQAESGRLIAGGVLAGALLGALLLLVAEFTTLFVLKTTVSGAPTRSIGTGSHHAYALVPVALMVAVLAYGVWRVGSRPALLAIGVLSVLALLIGLLGDLPDAHKSGLIATAGNHYATATASPSAGLYLETLGAIVLLITSVGGFLMQGPPVSPPRRHADPPSSAPAARPS